jgi:hypothetical protein
MVTESTLRTVDVDAASLGTEFTGTSIFDVLSTAAEEASPTDSTLDGFAMVMLGPGVRVWPAAAEEIGF